MNFVCKENFNLLQAMPTKKKQTKKNTHAKKSRKHQIYNFHPTNIISLLLHVYAIFCDDNPKYSDIMTHYTYQTIWRNVLILSELAFGVLRSQHC